MAPSDKTEAQTTKGTQVGTPPRFDVETGTPHYQGPVIAQVTAQPPPNNSFLEGDGFNIQWLLFVLGFFCWITSAVACFLPLCRRPRFPSKSYKAGWIANMVLAFVTGAILITLIVLCIVYSVSIYPYGYYYGSY